MSIELNDFEIKAGVVWKNVVSMELFSSNK
jgi:hypothetical protein